MLYAVVQETDEEFLRERAWKCTRWRWLLGMPFYREHLDVLIIQGGKSASAYEMRITDTPSAA